ncbi:MAG: hypothetical protein KJ558_03665 [Gammaproteobacteria bacterium]|nr:hypothetical protein [Gammaproteobacteria bacterium]MBU1653920.1 hypothetical protein [Gammaproteobacteria bacterium]MBU1960917.1 hypothetical protein [Gammaproteobacteria bacterium]
MDAITYFFFNSSLLIVVLAIVFFLLGLWLGWWLWGRCCPGQGAAQGSTEAAAPVPQGFGAFQAEVESGKARIDESLGLVYNEAPENRDDLTLIKGVAAVLNGKLNAFGIYTLKQIASWDDAVIQEFSKKLAFKDRVWREDWVGQAKALHKEKYGEDLG